jgi:hypothetical protein
MTTPNWQLLVEVKVQAKPEHEALWKLVYEYLAGPRRLRFKATGAWQRGPDLTCGPNGASREGLVDAANLAGGAQVGALIGKIGGSTADKGDSPAQVFAVGEYCVIHFPDTTRGGLFLTMNDKPQNFDQHSGELDVTIEEAP